MKKVSGPTKKPRPYNNIAKKIQKATGGPVVRKGEWELKREKDMRGQSKDGTYQGMSTPLMLQIAKERAAGETVEVLADRYGVSKKYLDDAMKRLFINNKQGREILKHLFTEGAVVMAMHSMTKVKDLNGMQAAMASKIFSDAGIALEKHEASIPKEVDVDELGEVKKLLASIDESIVATDDGSVLDERAAEGE